MRFLQETSPKQQQMFPKFYARVDRYVVPSIVAKSQHRLFPHKLWETKIAKSGNFPGLPNLLSHRIPYAHNIHEKLLWTDRSLTP